MPSPSEDVDFEHLRRRMVEQQLQSRGISDNGVLSAMYKIPREIFVPEEYRIDAYKDAPLPIGASQTISQPYMVALMTELLSLEPGDRVLEIGTGSGYQTAVLHAITPEVYSIERIGFLAQQAERILRTLGCETVTIRVGDGSQGWPEEAPFDAIMVTSGAPGIPETLKHQLAEGGRLVIPAGTRQSQTLYRVERSHDDFKITEHSSCVFVPLIGAYGWSEVL
jgi:protein-L-isoaspartate(D-aspartate) O-methyltransferase